MVAHNASFDMGFIRRAAHGLSYEWPCLEVLDTIHLARKILPKSEVGNYRLGTLATYFSTPVSPTHRALDDARATVDLLHALLERVGNQNVSTVGDLLEYSHMISRGRRSKKGWAQGLPEGPGVYFFLRDSERGRQYLYVGTSKRIRKRVSSYFTTSETRRRMDEMVNLATGVEAVECHTALEAAIVELRLITTYQPAYNRRSKQPCHTWIRTTDEPLPRLSIVRKPPEDGSAFLGPFSGKADAELAQQGLFETFPIRRCLDRLSLVRGREPCALLEISCCPAPCTGEGVDGYADIVAQVEQCLAGDIRPVREACHQTMDALSAALRFEEAQEIRDRLRAVEKAMIRQARLSSLASCPQIIAARHLGGRDNYLAVTTGTDPAVPCDKTVPPPTVTLGWEIHVFRYGQLAGAAVARPDDDPQRIAELFVATAKTVEAAVGGMPAGSIEEAELIATWMESDGVRLIDLDGVWGWPVHSG
jgi:DNA polymerase-3 subunit epsilon